MEEEFKGVSLRGEGRVPPPAAAAADAGPHASHLTHTPHIPRGAASHTHTPRSKLR